MTLMLRWRARAVLFEMFNVCVIKSCRSMVWATKLLKTVERAFCCIDCFGYGTKTRWRG